MLSAVRMDFYRMRKTRSFWGALAAILIAVVLSVAATKTDTQMEATPGSAQQEPAVGMMLSVEDSEEDPLTIADEITAHFQSRLVCIFTGIFAVLFGTADMKSGFIKTIGGQVGKRRWLVISKGIALAAFNAAAVCLTAAAAAGATKLFFPEAKPGAGAGLFAYLGMQFLLYTAFSWIVLALSLVTRSSVISVSAAICLCMNFQLLIYNALNRAAQNMGAESFDILNYTVTGNIFYLSAEPEASELIRCALVAAGFMAASLAAGIAAVQKRDI